MSKIFAVSFLALLVMNPVCVYAAQEKVSSFSIEQKTPDIADIPFIQRMVKDGASYHYMGTRSGLHGFLLVKMGQVQMFYVAPDKKSVVFGALFDDNGAIVTSQQIDKLATANKDVAAIFNGAAKQNIDIVRAGVAEGGIAEIPADPNAVKAVEEGPKRVPLLVTSPGERLIMDLKAASSIVLGNTSAPELLMVVSPNCFFCKETWKGLRGAVHEGLLHIRLVPIARNPSSDETRIAAQLLRSKDPLKAWEAYMAGDKDSLVGEPDKTAYRAIVANRVIIDRWNIMGTPYLVYRAKDQAIKIVQGKPERMAAVLADLVK